MTLQDLRNIIDIDFDIYDDEIDAGFNIGIEEIPEAVAKRLEVVKIGRDSITCKISQFVRKLSPLLLVKYYREYYHEGETRTYQISQLRNPDRNRIADDGGEALYNFITYDLYDFITDFLKERKQ